ncbi:MULTISPECIES: TraR/DksA family transcriptional regulator [unclassified Micromonospora]|uniref:TraR/DksA family transcriptional regulator n=1 Tax=unclassified Micromonospora TaxID=2617518 RepID=UPI0022B65CD9|nr:MULTISPECIES: TraR/DksA family transcriptional regulator [unclassified Micromonospora]MCZ7422858.1 TraR/DksA family transcriptional regulator [Verrucosispora sp. WMMA2121]WBB90592.1 TraR/DksA family transcriptional regulator [Verrucosispora sp. WMMC514]
MSERTDSHDQQWISELETTLHHEFEAQTTRLTELTADTGDPGEAHTNAALIAATRLSLDQIAGALRRLTAGGYGRCERCGTDIPRERLEILPHARFCVPCQQKQQG